MAAVQDDGAVGPGADGLDAGLDLRDHAAGNDALFLELLSLGHGQFRDQMAFLVQHARDIGQQQQAFGARRPGDGTRRRIGVDVIGLAPFTHTDRRDDGDEIALAQDFQDRRVAIIGLADETEIQHLLDIAFGILGRALQLARLDQPAILAGQADRLTAFGLQRGHDLFVDRACQNHFDDVDRFLVGDAQPVDEDAFLRHPVQHLADLRPAAMHDDRIHPDLFQQHDVPGKEPRQMGVAHGMTAVFHDQGLVIVPAHEGKRLGQDAGLRQPFDAPPRLVRRHMAAVTRRHRPILLPCCLAPVRFCPDLTPAPRSLPVRRASPRCPGLSRNWCSTGPERPPDVSSGPPSLPPRPCGFRRRPACPSWSG